DVRRFILENSNGRFVFRRSGSDWLMQEPLQVLAERTRVGQIVSRVSTEKARQFVEENPTSLKPYGLDKPGIRLEFYLADPQNPLTLTIGKREGARYFARASDRPSVFLVDSSFVRLMNPDLASLRDKKMAFFNESQVDRIELVHSGTTLVCAKDSSGTWSIIEPESRQAKGWVIRDLLKSVTDLQVQEFVVEKPRSLKQYGLEKPRARAIFYIQDFAVYELLLGNTRQDLVYAKRGDETRVVLLQNDILSKLTPSLEDIGLTLTETGEEAQ
ncbi:DUF4340 domain-containing protein, partial [candidate division KSB1 bacterium]|nr:DUF4340 domain-containing protein [candidate division KSB1 bacterium]